MQLLDTYLKTVARFLPAAERDDIVRELADNLRSQIEDREGQMNRPLTDGEVKGLLEGFGSPLEVAGRYRQDTRVLAFGRVLVGPLLFPFYAKVLAFNLGITATVIVIIGAALRTPAASMALSLLIHPFIQFAIVTVIFSLAEVGLARRPNSPGVLYLLSSPVAQPGSRDKPRISRLESLSQMVALAILLAWLPAFRDFTRDGMAEFGLAPANAWRGVYVVLACLWGAGIVQAGVNLLRPDWARFRSVARVASDLVWLGTVAVLLGAGRWVAPLDAHARATIAQAATVEEVNHGFFVGLVVIAAISAVVVVVDIRRSVRTTRSAPLAS